MNWKECEALICADYKRVKSRSGKQSLFRMFLHLIFNPSFEVTFFFRICSYFKAKRCIFYHVLSLPFVLVYKIISRNTGIQLPIGTVINGGLFFGHFSSIVIAGEVKIGFCCTLHQDVTIGRSFGGKKVGCPTIGDNVVIFPGAKVFGDISIGNNVVIGANSVVITDVPDDCVVAGVPSKIISRESRSAISESRNWFYLN